LIRLLALDLDGTLMGEDLQIATREREAIAHAQAHQVVVTLATGRMYDVALPFARELDIVAPLICYQGALIQAPDADRALHLTTMEPGLVHEVLDWQVKRRWHIALYTADRAFAVRRPHPDVFHTILARERISWVEDLSPVIEKQRPVKFIVVAEPPVADGIEAELRQRVGDRLAVVRSHASVVEGNPLHVSKGAALCQVARHLGIPQGQTMAVGDQDNDASMIAWAGLGVAMGNASPASLAVADWIAPSVVEHGAAVAIERFVLQVPAHAPAMGA
jgi:Cof subfamily protein (haloacid dehalogenase superfamily)